MPSLSLAAVLLVLIGAALMATAISSGRRIRNFIPPELQSRWRLIIGLMVFSLAGYLCLLVTMVGWVTLPVGLIAGPMVMAGAFFVLVVVNLTGDTITRIRSTERKLRSLNESLEERIAGRTKDLQQSHEFLRTVLDSLNDEVLIIDRGTFTIRDANESFLARHGMKLADVVGKTCHEVTHNRLDVCSPPNDICPLLETLETDRFAAVEHIHFDGRGRKVYAEVSTSPIRDPDGKIRRVVHVTRDVTERRKAEEALRKSEERYKSLFDSTMDGIFQVNAGGNFTLMNLAGARIFGFENPQEMIGRNALEFWRAPGDRDAYRSELKIKKTVSAYPMRARRINGEDLELESSSRIIEDEGGNFCGIEGILRDVTDRKKMEEELHSLSLRDELTGLYNRRGFVTLAAQELRMASRLRKGIYILYADMDGLKTINDTLGHRQGDAAIRETALILKDSFRNSDIIGRIGGDEFVIIPIGTAGDNIEVITGRLQTNLDRQNSEENRRYSLSLSIGVAYYDPEQPCAIEELLMKADSLMYEQKKNKRAS